MRELTVISFISLCTIVSGYVEAVVATVDRNVASTQADHSTFIPMVAFQCGYRNMHATEDGKWASDTDADATCLTGKLDILKYCRKSYPHLDITNIVEYHHRVVVDDWCKEEGSPCKWQHTVQPYTCIVGEFKNEALQVPDGCRFGHLDERDSCEEFAYWQGVSEDECGRHLGADSRTMRVRSFAVLQPCSIAKFSSVEFVCCPQMNAVKTSKDRVATTAAPILSSSKTIEESVFSDNDDEDSASYEDDDDEDDEEYFDDDESDEEDIDEEEEADKIIMEEIKNEQDVIDAETTTAKSTKKTTQAPALLGGEGEDDPYFRLADPENEHELYTAAVARLEDRHHARVVQVMKDWAESENRYEKMLETDPSRAATYKAETKADFHKTVQALDDEIKDQRRQVDEVHQERVQAKLNEHKRDAIRAYRDVLAEAVESPHPHKVLVALQAYIRAEEKDRTHSLNRYNHLLKSDADLARSERHALKMRLHDIDLRVNGTLAMLHDFPDLSAKVRPVALQFWAEFRMDNTPHTTDPLAVSIGGAGKDERVLRLYEERVEADTAVVDVEELVPEAKDESRHISPQLMHELEMIPGIEPVLSVENSFERHQSNHQQDMLVGGEHAAFTSTRTATTSSHAMLFMGSLSLVVLLIGALAYNKRRRARAGFIEVDLYSPEERQLAGMQYNGYENPTYHHFEKV